MNQTLQDGLDVLTAQQLPVPLNSEDRFVGDKSGRKHPGHVYVMRQPNGLTSALIALPAEGFSPKCDYIDLGPCPEFSGASESTPAPALLPDSLRALADWIDIHEAAELVCDIDVDLETQAITVHMLRSSDFRKLFPGVMRVTEPWCRGENKLTVALPFAEFWHVV